MASYIQVCVVTSSQNRHYLAWEAMPEHQIIFFGTVQKFSGAKQQAEEWEIQCPIPSAVSGLYPAIWTVVGLSG